MGKIKNIGLGALNNKNEITIYSISAPKNTDGLLEDLKNDMDESVKNSDVDTSYYGSYNKQVLVNEDPFFLNLPDINKDDEFFYIKEGLTKFSSLSACQQIGLSSKYFKGIEAAKQKIRFFILELTDKFLLCRINPHNQIIRNKKGVAFTTQGLPNKFSITYGIQFPEYVSAVLEKESKRLNVVDAHDFESMFNLRVVRMALANDVFSKFKSQEYSIGKSSIKVVFSDFIDVSHLKARQITYLSSFDHEQVKKYDNQNIEEAMEHLKAEERVSIDDDNRIIVSTYEQFKTFVAILHDSILHRMLTDRYESL